MMSEFAARRKQLMQKIGPSSIVILPAAPVARRNGDYDYAYRQNSDFYYLTGFEEPAAVTIIAPHRPAGEFILFSRPKIREQEIWEGYRAGQKGACEVFGANEAFPIAELESKLPEFLEGRDAVYYAIGIDPAFDVIILNAVNTIRSKIRNGLQPPIAFYDLIQTLHEMRLIKSSAEIEVIKKAANISVDAHIKAMKACRPNRKEYELEAELQYEFNRQGARFPAYTSIVGSGANSCILHYNSNNQAMKDGDLVLIDAGCEYQNYASDITRTFPVNGKFSQEQHAIYDIVLKAQLAGIDVIKPGVFWPKIQEVMVQIITQGLVDLGLLKGEVADLIQQQAYFTFYMHKSGHWLGLDVHDVGRYKIDGQWRVLQSGMVLTVEPGIYISRDMPDVPEKWHNIGVRIEDDILVTEKGHEVLTAGLPKKISDIEKLMSDSVGASDTA